jgi:ankyrin repeat protein
LKWELVNAVRSNEVDLVKTFLDDGGDPNTTCDEPFTGSSLLSIACDLGYIDLVKLLVSRGANVEHRDAIVKYTPFLKASKHGHVPVLQFLLDQGCNKNARTVVS